MRLTTRLVAVALSCLLASPALAQSPSVALTTGNQLTDCLPLATCRLNLQAAASGANSDITSLAGLTTALPLSEGGLGATTAAGGRATISAAASGANTDITSLGALTNLTSQTLQFTSAMQGPGGVTIESGAAPTIASGFGASPSILAANGTAAFAIKVGTGGLASSGVLTMPAARTGWACQFQDVTTHSALVAFTFKTAGTTTSVSLANFSDVLALGSPWGAGDVIEGQCAAY
jgi:hypothetical protein